MAREVSLTPKLATRLGEMVAALDDQPTTCREYLGKALGYCPGAPQIVSTHDGRGFCTEHATERDL